MGSFLPLGTILGVDGYSYKAAFDRGFNPLMEISADIGTITAMGSDAEYLYVAVSPSYVIRKYRKADLSYVAQTPSYGGTINAITVDDAYIYAGGSTTQILRRYNRSTMAFVSDANTSYDGPIKGIWLDGAFIYVVGGGPNRISKYNLSDLSLVAQSAAQTGNITSLWVDASYIYIGTSDNYIRRFAKSTLTEQTYADTAAIVNGVVADDRFVYAAGGAGIVKMYDKSSFALVSQSVVYGGSIYALAIDANYVYAAGATTQKVVRYRKTLGLEIVAETTPHGDTISSLVIDDGAVYAATNKLLKHADAYKLSYYQRA